MRLKRSVASRSTISRIDGSPAIRRLNDSGDRTQSRLSRSAVTVADRGEPEPRPPVPGGELAEEVVLTEPSEHDSIDVDDQPAVQHEIEVTVGGPPAYDGYPRSDPDLMPGAQDDPSPVGRETGQQRDPPHRLAVDGRGCHLGHGQTVGTIRPPNRRHRRDGRLGGREVLQHGSDIAFAAGVIEHANPQCKPPVQPGGRNQPDAARLQLRRHCGVEPAELSLAGHALEPTTEADDAQRRRSHQSSRGSSSMIR